MRCACLYTQRCPKVVIRTLQVRPSRFLKPGRSLHIGLFLVKRQVRDYRNDDSLPDRVTTQGDTAIKLRILVSAGSQAPAWEPAYFLT